MALGDERVLEIVLRARDEASKVIERASRHLRGNFDEAEKASKGFGLGLLGAGTAAAGFIGYGAKIAADLEASRQGFITLLGDAEKADAALALIKKDAAATPFELPGLIQANQLLTSVTKDAGKSESLLLNVGKALAAMGKGQNELDRIIVNLQQIGAVGHASLVDIRQFAFNGIPIFEMLSEATGKTGTELEDLISSGGVTFEALTEMFNEAGSAGGRFANAFENQAGTFNQLVSNMTDSFRIFLADTLQRSGIFDMLKNGMSNLINFMNTNGRQLGDSIVRTLDWLRQNGPVVAGIILGALTPAIIGFALSVGAATLALAPYIAAGATVGLLAKVIIDNWEPISGFFTGVWTTVSSVAQTAVTAMNNGADWLKNHWVEALGFMIGFVATLPIKLPMYMDQAISWMIARVAAVDWGSVFMGILSGAVTIFKGVMDAGERAWNYLKNLDWGSILTAIGKGIANAIIGMIEGAINGALSGIPNMKKVSLPRFASGTDFAPGGYAIVGERGPEIVNLPRGSQVIPNRQTEQILNTNQKSIVMNNHFHTDISADTLIRQLSFAFKFDSAIL